MPNHVTHRVFVDGTAEEIARFKSECIRSETETAPNGVESTYLRFDFNTLIPMPEILAVGLALIGRTDVRDYFWNLESFDRMLEYPWVKRLGIETAEQLRDYYLKERPDVLQLGEKAAAAFDQTGYTSWYGWSIANWGTKWNSYSFEFVKDEPEHLEFTFDTAWSVPFPVLEALAPKYPQLKIMFVAFDEGWNFAAYGTIGDGEADITQVDATKELFERVYGEPYETLDDEDEEAACECEES